MPINLNGGTLSPIGYGSQKDLDVSKQLELLRQLRAQAEQEELKTKLSDPLQKAHMDASVRQFETRKNVVPMDVAPSPQELPTRNIQRTPLPDVNPSIPTRAIQRIGTGKEFTDPDAAMGAEAKARLAPSVLAAEEAGENRTERLVQVMGPNGVPIYAPASQAIGQPATQAPRTVTGAERQALSYFNRAKDASDTIGTKDASGTSLEDRVTKAGLMTQAGLQVLPNVMQSADMQAYRQSQRAFTEARLRKESGAAIPTAEYTNDARTYFGQPGDAPEVVDQKKHAREVVLTGLKFASGRAHEEFYGTPGRPDLSGNASSETATPAGAAAGSDDAYTAYLKRHASQ